LGLTKTATPEDIKDAYRKMAMKHHPDLQRGKEGHQPDAQKFRDIMEAYSVLSVRESRVSYDLQVRKNPDAYEAVSEVEFARRHRPDMRAKTGTITKPTVGAYAAERMQELKEQRD
jgi:DnaJ-class molecular chaperone